MSESPTPTPLFCTNHPQRETVLRCNRCEKPICIKCAVLTPTGYRCKECVRGQQKIFETATGLDYFLAVVVGGVLSFLGSMVIGALGYFTLLLAPFAGIVIAEAIRLATRRRRSLWLLRLAVAAVVLGSLPSLLAPVLGLWLIALLTGDGASTLAGLGGLGFNLILQAAYTFLVASSVYYRLGGIRIR